MPQSVGLAVSGLAVVLMVGGFSCSKSEPAAPALPQVATGEGSVTGVVRLEGTPPAPKEITVACNPSPDAPKMLHRDLTVEVGEGNGLAGVYVYVTASTAHASLKGSGAAEPALMLDQVDCYFVPHALGIQVGQPLKIRNSDPTFHNVHWDPKVNSPVNIGFAPSGKSPEQVLAFTAPEFIAVRCDVHPWMTSTIGVFDHPFFAVTDANGKYTLSRLPPGEYTLATHHPFYGPGPTTRFTVPPPSPAPSTPPAAASSGGAVVLPELTFSPSSVSKPE